jgi:serine/threonine-protein kinase HipA
MGLHLVGETIDKTRSHYQAETGKLVQLMRGVYVDADDHIDATVLKHAVRIAKYLYPRAYLSAASAVLLGPTRAGRLFLSGRRNKRTRIRALEIIQNEVPNIPRSSQRLWTTAWANSGSMSLPSASVSSKPSGYEASMQGQSTKPCARPSPRT